MDSQTSGKLWNHALTNGPFTLHGVGAATAADLDKVTRLCLSCHDGTVALQSFGGNTASGTTYMTGTANVGTDLSNDHPVSFTYDAALAIADPGLWDPTTKVIGGSGSPTITAAWLPGNKLECSSCHDVHNNAPGTPVHLLNKSNTASALCLTCHNK